MKRFSLTTLITVTLLVVLVSLLSACGSSSDSNTGNNTASSGLLPNTTPAQQAINSSSNNTPSQQAQGFTINVDSIQLESAQGTDAYGNSYSQAQILRFVQDDLDGVQFYLSQGSLSDLHYHNAYADLYCSIDLTNDTITASSYSYAIRQGVVSSGEGGNGGTSGFTVSFTASIQTF